jgi:hypothetical protein
MCSFFFLVQRRDSIGGAEQGIMAYREGGKHRSVNRSSRKKDLLRIKLVLLTSTLGIDIAASTKESGYSVLLTPI